MSEHLPAAPLGGRTVVVTRAAEQAGALSNRLRAAGATVVEIPLIATVDPPDGGAALLDAVTASPGDAWLVVTSPNGAHRLAAALRAIGTAPARRIAVVGPGTAEVLRNAGFPPALLPDQAVAEGLLAAFPSPDHPGQVVVLAQAEAARLVLAEGLRAAGYEVRAVVAYRTMALAADPATLTAAAAADAIAFTSGSTVEAWVAAGGAAHTPPVVVSIGPVTTEVAERAGLVVTRTAIRHDLDGLVVALTEALAASPENPSKGRS